MSYARHGQNLTVRGRAEAELEAVIAMGKETEWYDDALYQLAMHPSSVRAARSEVKADSGPGSRTSSAPRSCSGASCASWRKARRKWHDEASSYLQQITEPSVWVQVDSFFLPGSRIDYRLGWRNAAKVDLALYRTDLTRDVALEPEGEAWLESIALARLEAVQRWEHETGDTGDHHPGQTSTSLEDELEAGAYVLEVTAHGKASRALVLVSDVGLTTKATGGETLAWLTNVQTGEPVAGAGLRLWRRHWESGRHHVRELRGETDGDGIFRFETPKTEHHAEYFLAAKAGSRQAYVTSGVGGSGSSHLPWRIYAFTDRPAYRPGDEVSWKAIARTYDGTRYATPSEAQLSWSIYDPLGAVVKEGTATLDGFGSTWATLATEAAMPLGEYTVRFEKKGQGQIGYATLFRLEEYKLPEFEVSVRVPEDEAGQPKLHVLGDEVEVEIDATYYFGGPVGEATVEVYVYQRPYWHAWPKEREFAWFYDQPHQRWWGGERPAGEARGPEDGPRGPRAAHLRDPLGKWRRWERPRVHDRGARDRRLAPRDPRAGQRARDAHRVLRAGGGEARHPPAGHGGRARLPGGGPERERRVGRGPGHGDARALGRESGATRPGSGGPGPSTCARSRSAAGSSRAAATRRRSWPRRR